VHFTLSEGASSRNLNTLVQTKEPYFSRAELGKAQQILQVRLMRETFPENAIPADVKVTDVFILSVSALGLMSDEEFQKGYDALVKEASAPH
jgi:hypothetical protein